MANTPARIFCSDGFEVYTFTRISIRQSFTDPLGAADFDIKPPRSSWGEHVQRLQRGEEIRIKIGDANLGRWLIQTAERHISADGGLTIQLRAESLLCTAYEGGVDPDFTLAGKDDASIEKVVLDILGPYGFSVVQTDPTAHINASTGKPIPNGVLTIIDKADLKTKQQAAHEDQTAVQFLNAMITRLRAVMHVDTEGNLLITGPAYDQAVAYAVTTGITGVSTELADPFWGDVKVTETNKGQYSQVKVIGQASSDDDNASRPKPEPIKAADVLPRLCAYKSSLHGYKPLFHKDKKSRDQQQANNVAHLVLGSHATNAYQVHGAVDGWVSKTGRVWAPNTMCEVYVEPEELDEPMFLLERTLLEDADIGQKTMLTFIPKGALILGPKK